MHVEIWQFGIGLAVVCVGAALYSALTAQGRIKRLQAQIEANPVTEVPPAPTADYTETFRAISARVAALEGQLPAITAGIDGFSALATRVTAVEAHMPGLQDAYETYADSIARKEKRDDMRDKRAGKTAAEAAAELVGAPHQLGPAVQPPNGQPAAAPSNPIALGTRRGGKR